jgi:cytochrome d ubiquinol oxidase subunit II
MQLTTVWFLLIAVLWTGYFFLEGFDFGVGMLLPVLGRDDAERRVVINTIGPVWDGNEVWLLTAGGATFAAFPEWYASLFSGFYLPLLAILGALIVRVVAFEYRGKRDSAAWRRGWDRCIVAGSAVPAVLWGVAFANLVRGVPLDRGHHYVGTVFDLLNPYALLGGVATGLLFLLHGAVFLALKTRGEVRRRARLLAARVGLAATAVGGAFLLWTQLAHGKGGTWAPVLVAVVALGGALAANRAGREGWAFVGTGVAIVALAALLFGALFPAVMPSTLTDAGTLTTTNAASTGYTLRLMTIVAAVFTPLVLLYQGWTYWVFRRRIGVGDIPAPAAGPAPAAAPGIG